MRIIYKSDGKGNKYLKSLGESEETHGVSPEGGNCCLCFSTILGNAGSAPSRESWAPLTK